MIRTTTPATKAMNKAEAKAITERIRKHIDAAWADIERAYAGKAWKALGYASWEAYVRDEFDMSRRHSYRLIDQARVIHEIAKVTGESVTHGSQITERIARKIKPVLPAVTAEIKSRVEQGEDPEKAVAATVAAKRAEQDRKREERKAQQAENDSQREAARAALPDHIKRAESAKAANGAQAAVAGTNGLSPQQRIAEMEEAVAALETENRSLKDEIKFFAEMKTEWEKGGFEEVIRGKDEVIRAQASRIESESQEKVRNLRSAEYWKAEAIKLGWSRNEVIDLEAVNG